jgi:SsrA-binding protein
MKKLDINIKYKKASYLYEWVELYIAGIMLLGTEIKSIRNGNVSFTDSFCYFKDDGLYLKNVHIAEYDMGTINNHEPKRDRKLLLTKNQLKKLRKSVNEKGLTIIPTRIFINETGFAKVEIALAKGKKTFDKKETIKSRDIQRDTDRVMNE